MRLFRRQAISVALAFSTALGLTPVFAVMLELQPDNPANAPSAAPYASIAVNNELQDVVTLLKQGERKEAKLQLARFLARHPQDPRATEVAGLIFMEEKNWKMAIVSFRRVLSVNPAQTSARSKLGVSLLMDGQRQEGAAELQRVVSINKADGMARRYLGWLAETQGDTKAALGHYTEAIGDPRFGAGMMSEFHVLTAKLFNQTQQYDKTIKLLAPLIGKADSSRTGRGGELVLASAYLEQGDKAAAARLIRSLEKTLPSVNPDLRLAQAALFKLEKDYPKARERLQAIIKENPAYSRLASLQLSEVYVLEGNRKQAIGVLESLVSKTEKKDLSPLLARLTAFQFDRGSPADAIKTLKEHSVQNPSVKYLLAEAQARNHQYALALRTVNELLAESPQFAGAHYLAAMLYIHENKPSEAEAGFLQAVKLIPAFVDAWVELGDLYISANALPKAESTLQKALEANPDNPTLLFKLASILDQSGKTAQANSAYRRIVEKMPNHAPALQKLALNLSTDSSTLSEAQKLAERAYALAQNEPSIQDTYGWVLVQSGDLKKGTPLLEAAVKAAQHHREHLSSHDESDDHSHESNNLAEGNAYYHLGVAYMKGGKYAEGAAYLNRALHSGVDSGTRTQIASLLK
ncbi:tetratricopeptide repeat protein [Nitrosospira sp. Is2]|uniref:tetratricopeptide repeat protein n=1 Tax=Nitrosospira sp. Is2 TaxID=3080532 RepID=UPI002952B157|nr:tetratricopeptide repeat protein [Nitrosospira sp. Is2]WON72520.1 tetratricopeptide repeat protein [Nitrosospira sp. Is2]